MGVKIPVEYPGQLERYGYHVSKTSRARHRALANAVRHLGKERVWHELHAGSIRDMNTQPHNAEVLRADRNWVQRKWGKGR